MDKEIFKKKSKCIPISDFKLYYRQKKNRYKEQHRNKPMHLWSIIFDKSSRNTKGRKDTQFNQQWWENKISTYKRKGVPYLMLYKQPIQNVLHVNILNLKTPRRKQGEKSLTLVLEFLIRNQKNSKQRKRIHRIIPG